jgi:anti-sigma factor RsiW
MNLSTTTMLAILDGHGEPQERQEMRRLLQEAGVDAPLQRWRAVGARLELTLLNGKIIYLPPGGTSAARAASSTEAAGETKTGLAQADKQPGRRGGKDKPKKAAGGAHGLHP